MAQLAGASNPDGPGGVNRQTANGKSARNSDVVPALTIVVQDEIVIPEKKHSFAILNGAPVLIVTAIVPGAEKLVQGSAEFAKELPIAALNCQQGHCHQHN